MLEETGMCVAVFNIQTKSILLHVTKTLSKTDTDYQIQHQHRRLAFDLVYETCIKFVFH